VKSTPSSPEGSDDDPPIASSSRDPAGPPGPGPAAAPGNLAPNSMASAASSTAAAAGDAPSFISDRSLCRTNSEPRTEPRTPGASEAARLVLGKWRCCAPCSRPCLSQRYSPARQRPCVVGVHVPAGRPAGDRCGLRRLPSRARPRVRRHALPGGRRVRGARKTSRQEGRQAGGRGWGGVACGASQQDPSRTTAVRPGHPVARLGGRRGRDRAARRSGGVGWCGPGGRRCVPPSSPALRLPSFVTPASLRWPCWPRVATGCGSTVCPGGCVHRAGQRLQRHDLVRPAGLSAT